MVVESELAAFSDSVWWQMPRWIRDHASREQHRKWVRVGLGRVGDEGWAKKGAAAIAWPGAWFSDYCEQILTINRTSHVVGIRFFGGKGGKPFVDINMSTARHGAIDWCALLDAALQAYGRFQPSCLRRLRWLEHGEEMTPAPGWTLDQVLVAAPLGSLLEEPSAMPECDFAIGEISDRDALETAAVIDQLYSAWYEKSPWMRGFVTPQGEASLRTAIRDGVALAMTWDGETAGVVSAIPEPEYRTGCPGIAVYEKVVHPRLSRLGLSHPLHYALVKALAAKFERETIVYGTIDARNKPSIKNATRAGRKPAAVLELLAT